MSVMQISQPFDAQTGSAAKSPAARRQFKSNVAEHRESKTLRWGERRRDTVLILESRKRCWSRETYRCLVFRNRTLMLQVKSDKQLWMDDSSELVD